MCVRTVFAVVLMTFVAAGAWAAGDAATTQQARLGVPDLTPVAVQPAPDHDPVEIVKDGKARAVVYVAEAEPSPNLNRLVEELVRVVRLSTDAELQLVDAMPAADVPAIVIGDCPEARGAGIDPDAIPIEGFVVKTAPERLYLVGSVRELPVNTGHNDPYANDGTAWAVADFLERFVGVRWYWPIEVGGRTIRRTDSIVIPPVHYADHPVFRKRLNWPTGSYTKPWKSRWFDKEHPQPSPVAIPPEIERLDMATMLAYLRGGNSWPYLIKVHQPQGFRRNIERWQNHQEMFAKRADGSTDYRMLCYSSPEAYDFLMKGCEEWWDEGKHTAPWVTETSVSISPTDYPVACQCELCKPKYDPDAPSHGNAGGQASRLMGEFVLKFAREVQERWPDKKVVYLPYWNYALYPEGMEFPDNLEIEMCTTGFPTYRMPGLRASIDRSLRTWAEKIDRRISSWEYTVWVVNWTHASIQYPHLVRDYYQDNRDVLIGSFLNGGFLGEWSRSAPTSYILMRVLWNPDVNIDAIYEEMCRRLFGEAAETARELLQLQTDRWEKAQWRRPLPSAGRITTSVFVDTWPPEVVERMSALRQKAREQLKDDPVGLQRLEYWLWTFDAFLKEARQVYEKAGIETE